MTCPKCSAKLQIGQDIELAQTLRCDSCSLVVIVPHGDFQVQSYRLQRTDEAEAKGEADAQIL